VSEAKATAIGHQDVDVLSNKSGTPIGASGSALLAAALTRAAGCVLDRGCSRAIVGRARSLDPSSRWQRHGRYPVEDAAVGLGVDLALVGGRADASYNWSNTTRGHAIGSGCLGDPADAGVV
jgi:hypothetical protein